MGSVSALLELLSAEQRRGALGLLLLMLIGMALETLSIGLVIPALTIMTSPDFPVGYPAAAAWMARLGGPSREQLAIGGVLALVLVYTIKTGYLAYLAWRQSGFVADVQVDLSQRLFSGYLRQPYVFHLQRNSAELIRNTINQVSDVANVVYQWLQFATEVLAMAGISVLLLALEPIGALLVVSSLGVAGMAFHRATRTRTMRWGTARQHHDLHRIQHLQQGLGGVKDVILLGREADFVEEYRSHNAGSARANRLQWTLQSMPRLWLELLAVCGLAGLVVIFVVRGRPMQALLPILGVFGAAAFRLMPSANRILAAIQTARFSIPAVDNLRKELAFLAREERQDGDATNLLPFSETLALDSVSFRYPATDASALQNVALSIQKGTSVGIIGESGSGKSTLVDVILGLLAPQAGAVRIDGTDIRAGLRSWQRQIGYVPQAIYLTDDSIRRNVAFGLRASQIDDDAVWRALRAAQLDRFVRDLPAGLDSVVGERGVRLSGGQRQRIGIARALYHDPAVLVLDEATSALDTATERDVMEAVRALHGEKTILIVAHRLTTVEHCDRLVRLERGSMVETAAAHR